MHRAPVTGLCFRQWSSMLVSCSSDSTLRLWSVPEMHCEDKFYGHNGPINNISSLRKERCASAGADRTVRHWKLDAATQVEFQTGGSAAECVAMIDDVHIVAGSTSGDVFLFDVNRRNYIQKIEQPHGAGYVGDGTGLEMLEGTPSPTAASRGNAITAIAALPYGDLVATASYSGTIALWHFSGFATTSASAPKRGREEKREEGVPRPTNRLELVATFPCVGCVNSLQFSPDGSVLIASVGKDERTGRWLTVRSALNGVLVVPLHEKGEDEIRAITATQSITASTVQKKNAETDRKMHRPLVEDPSHQPLTEEAKREARKKKRLEIIQRRKDAREIQKKKREERDREEAGEEDGDEIDNWNEADDQVAPPAKKKSTVEKSKKFEANIKTKKAAVPVPVIADDDGDDSNDDASNERDFSEEAFSEEDGAAAAFKLGKDGQFIFGGAADDTEEADEAVSMLRKGGKTTKSKKHAASKKSMATAEVPRQASRKSESAAPMKKKKVAARK
eukprot:GILJ01025331.1.p1 GENE.GILJ01025331.1~~GILJ01025331.1.p1  ORF type:complete len:587 (+),score=126.24 GILJ01025331.1:244-1761(+)